MSPHTMKLPDLGEGVVEAEVAEWLVQVGDAVTLDTPIANIVTDKAEVEISAPIVGTVVAILVADGDRVTVGTEILRIDPTPASPPDAGATVGVATAANGSPARPLAAPPVRLRARELGIDLGAVTGTGPGGRILRNDVEALGRVVPAPAPTSDDVAPPASSSPTPAEPAEAPTRRPDVTEPVRGIRRTISERLTAAWTAPHITYVEEVDVTELEHLRDALNHADDTHFTLLPFVARAMAEACDEYPRMNATFDAVAETLTLHGAVHLGVATQTDRGLLVPVVRDADRLSLTELAAAIASAASNARAGTSSPRDLGGSTLTVTSLGALGGLMNTPILNAPEVAIVGVNKLRTAPVWNGSSFVPRSVINLSASFDHRIIDGHDAALFIQRVRELLEAPGLLTLGWRR